MQFGRNYQYKFLHYGKDGGPESRVWGFWFIGIKSLFSVALLRFEDGSRDAFHSHAFDCVSWVLRGRLFEDHIDGKGVVYFAGLRPIITRRATFHRVTSVGRTWVLTFRGPWKDTWREWLPESKRFVTLTHGRKEVRA